ncbi:MAG: hypothetical protein O210_OD1C00001G0075 [Parcubacteria bacterium RAAC4_OD1_1]|nr:MAG: hypothetical protein O210_OD1C00001G0075 [Parcubacteria bacterium RAAC4_OD1_1]
MHQLRDKKQILRRKKIIKNTTIFIVIFLLFTLGIVSWSNDIFYKMGLPIWQSKNFIRKGIDGAGYLVKSKKIVFKENQILKKENEDLRISMLDYQILKKENEDLKELMNRKNISNDFVLANILSKPSQSPYDTIIIDIGDSFDIEVGDIVYANGDIPIGTIEKIESKLSLVSLFTNPGRKTEGIIENINSSVELLGRGGGNFEVSLPVELDIIEGTKILLPSLNPEVLAISVGVISKPNDPIKRIILNSPVNIQNLKWVEVKIN